MKTIKVLFKKPGEMIKEMEIEDKLEVLQDLVGGLIEVVSFSPDIDMICNEEGKLLKLKENINLDYDIIVGNVIFCSYDEEGNFTSLTDEQKEYIYKEMIYRDIV